MHGCKATDLLYEMVRRKNYLLNPVSRQNFANALAENHNLKLEVCLIQLYVVTLGHNFFWTPQSALFFLKCIIMVVERGAHFFFEDLVTF